VLPCFLLGSFTCRLREAKAGSPCMATRIAKRVAKRTAKSSTRRPSRPSRPSRRRAAKPAGAGPAKTSTQRIDYGTIGAVCCSSLLLGFFLFTAWAVSRVIMSITAYFGGGDASFMGIGSLLSAVEQFFLDLYQGNFFWARSLSGCARKRVRGFAENPVRRA